jgi:biopolymer transport protein ExbD
MVGKPIACPACQTANVVPPVSESDDAPQPEIQDPFAEAAERAFSKFASAPTDQSKFEKPKPEQINPAKSPSVNAPPGLPKTPLSYHKHPVVKDPLSTRTLPPEEQARRGTGSSAPAKDTPADIAPTTPPSQQQPIQPPDTFAADFSVSHTNEFEIPDSISSEERFSNTDIQKVNKAEESEKPDEHVAAEIEISQPVKTIVRPSRIQFAEEDEEEELSFKSRLGDGEDMDLTPMVDVTFLLLIFFMITASFTTQKSIPIPKPDPSQKGAMQTQTLEDLENQSIIVEIAADNVITVDEVKLSNTDDLTQQLIIAGQSGSKIEIVIMPDPMALNETIVKVIDAANDAGLQKIRLASLKES